MLLVVSNVWRYKLGSYSNRTNIIHRNFSNWNLLNNKLNSFEKTKGKPDFRGWIFPARLNDIQNRR